MSTVVLNSLEQTMEAVLAGESELTELASNSPATLRRLALARLGRRSAAAADSLALLGEAATSAAKALEADHYVLVGPRGGTGETWQRWGALFPDVLGDDAGEQHFAAAAERSACAYAMSVGRPVVIDNLAGELRFRDALLARLGASSGLVCALGTESKSSGALGIFNRRLRSYTPDEVLFLDGLSQLVAAAISRLHTESLLANQGRFLATVMDSTESLVLALGRDGTIQNMNRACQEATGFQPAEVKQRTVWSAFFIPEEIMGVKGAFDRVRLGGGSERIESFVLTKHGDRRRVAWTFSLLAGEKDETPRVVATGQDMTGQLELMNRLNEAEQTANDARRTLAEAREHMEREASRLERAGAPAERRGTRRRSFPHIQMIAPVSQGRLPNQGEFAEIRCRDISSRGFSFLAPVPYEAKQIVIGFGPPPSAIYLLADVVHATPFRYEGRSVYLVGCKYLQRIAYSA